MLRLNHRPTDQSRFFTAMQDRPLLIISTRLPPQTCGVGTFSWHLEQHWPGSTFQHRFLVVEGADDSRVALNRNGIAEFGKGYRGLKSALQKSGAIDVLLHYAGNAYQGFGCPIGLARVLRDWKTRSPGSRLIIFFHELPPGRPLLTSKRYWLDVCGRRIAGKFANLADLVITNTPEHARLLEEISRHREVPCLPVPSNIESKGDIHRQRARTEFVIFGLPFGRWQTLQLFDAQIRNWQENGVLTKLHLIGPLDKKFDARSEALLQLYPRPNVVVRHGQLDAADVSRILSGVRFAFTMATDANWSKSGTLMAFLLHGCVVIAKSRSATEPLSWAITPEQVVALPDEELEAKITEARRWYDQNADWKVLAQKVASLIARLPPSDA